VRLYFLYINEGRGEIKYILVWKLLDYLIGLSESLAKTPLLADTPVEMPRVPKRETLVGEMLTEHEQSLTSYFNGFYHRHGKAALRDVTKAAQHISIWIPHVQEYTQQRGITLISRYYQFCTVIARDQQQYEVAIAHADKAIEYAEEAHKIKPNSDLMAIVAYRRGLTSFQQESTCVNQNSNYHDAIPYFDDALSHAQSSIPHMKGFISLEWGSIHANTATSEKERTAVRKRLADGYGYISEYREEDDINFLKCNTGWYYLKYAEALIALGDYTEALGQLELAEELTPLTLPRRFAYIDALRAKAYVGLREFPEAVNSAKDALTESRTVKSDYNIARIAQVYRQLKEKYKHVSDVTELGRELAKTHPHLVVS
jgi:tetratricopeptide (TPR) repeat protein